MANIFKALNNLSRQKARFDKKATLPVFSFVAINNPNLTASYEIACLITKQGTHAPLVRHTHKNQLR